MNLTTKTVITPDDRKLVTEQLKKYHQPAFDMLGEKNPFFQPRPVFTWNNEIHVSLYKKELTAPVFYMELINDDMSPKDSQRTLYKFRGNAECINEYFSKSYTGQFGEYSKYFVPLEDFEKVDLNKVLKPNIAPTIPFEDEEFYKTEDELEDALMSKLTIRDHAAIQWKLPVSQKKWLNKLIQEINRK